MTNEYVRGLRDAQAALLACERERPVAASRDLAMRASRHIEKLVASAQQDAAEVASITGAYWFIGLDPKTRRIGEDPELDQAVMQAACRRGYEA